MCGDEHVLACPTCGSSYLYHGRVVIYDRAEDAQRVLRTIVDRQSRASNGLRTIAAIPARGDLALPSNSPVNV
jgi:DNA-directed RNA polymerase subunit RPC12/RpoP